MNSVLLERGINQKYHRAQAKKRRETESSETNAFKQTLKWQFGAQGNKDCISKQDMQLKVPGHVLQG